MSSNMQDVPLAEHENATVTPSGSDTVKSKSNTLKRLFKMGKKSATNVDADNLDGTETSDQELPDAEADGKEGQGKPNTISRFLTRFKGQHKPDGASGASNIDLTEDAGNQSPNAKNTLKTSLSNYWRTIFKRHQANQHAGDEQKPPGEEGEIEQPELETEAPQRDAPSGPTLSEMAPNVAPKRPEERNLIPEILEEVQMLAMSDDVEAGGIESQDGTN